MTEKKEKTKRQELLEYVGTLSPEIREAFAFIVETAEVQGGYSYSDDTGSVWADSVAETLNSLAQEIRRL